MNDNDNVLARYKLPARNGDRPAEIVLRDVGGYQRFVTHVHTLDEDAYYNGHYFGDRARANEDFAYRCARGF